MAVSSIFQNLLPHDAQKSPQKAHLNYFVAQASQSITENSEIWNWW